MTRFSFVDALRGMAALSVVLFHAIEGNHITELAEAMPAWLRTALEHGGLGVAIFFVLSGFVIAHSLRDQKMSFLGVGRFMLKRSLRLDPPYWAAILLSTVMSLLATRFVRSHTPEEFSAAQIISHIFYAQDILGFKNINPVFWTLCFEVQFYFLFALLLVFPRWIFIPVFAVSLLWPLGIGPTVHHGLFPTLWYGFLLGVLSYWAWKDTRLIPAFLVYAALIAVAALLNSDPFALTCVVAASVLLAAGLTGMIGAWNWRWLQFLGTISYSLYLLHNPISGATFRVGFMMTGRSVITEAVWWLISTAVCIAAAFGFWYFVERPCLNLARRFSRESIKPSLARREGSCKETLLSNASRTCPRPEKPASACHFSTRGIIKAMIRPLTTPWSNNFSTRRGHDRSDRELGHMRQRGGRRCKDRKGRQ